MTGIAIRSGIRPGDLGRLISLHGEAYEGEAGPYGVAFEAHVAGTIAEFMIDNGGRGEVFFAEEETGALAGTAAMVERRRPGGVTEGQLHWVVLSPRVRGTGLDASMALYKKRGFEIVSERRQNLRRGDNLVITMALEFGR